MSNECKHHSLEWSYDDRISPDDHDTTGAWVCTCGEEFIAVLFNEYVAKNELVEVLEELMELMDDVREGNYTPDTFTTQPARIVLAKTKRQNATP